MTRKKKYLLYFIIKLVEYLPFFFSDLTSQFIVSPVFSLLIFLGASEDTKNFLALKLMTFPAPPLWLIVGFIALVPGLLVVFTLKNIKALVSYVLFATLVDLVVVAFVLGPTILGLNSDLVSASAGLIALLLAGGLLAARLLGFVINILLTKIIKIKGNSVAAS